jgi:hypothetical protein
MTPQAIIRAAYSDCLQLAKQHQEGWTCHLEAAFEAAQQGERQHRKGHPGRCKVSILDAARYFTATWFLDQTKGPESWTAACTVRDDVRLALGARDLCPGRELNKLRKAHAAFLALNYSDWWTP